MALKASFIGLGQMGYPMANNLLKHGIDLAVYNRSKEKALPLINAGAKLLEHPSDAFKHGPIVFSMVSNDQALEDISEGRHGLLEGAYPESIHVSLSTVAPATTHKLKNKHEEKGVHFIAAPVFGRPDVAAKQELWICCAGEETSKRKVEPLLNMMGKKVYDFGDKPEAVNAIKLAGNFMILAVIDMLGEAFAFVKKNEIEPKQLYQFLIETLFPSPVFHNYGKLIVEQRFLPAGFKLELGLKDINLFISAAEELQVNIALAQELKKQLLLSMDKGRKEFDWSAISLLPLETPSESI